MTAGTDEGASILRDGDKLLTEMDGILGLGTLFDLGQEFLDKRGRKSAQSLKGIVTRSQTSTTYNHWSQWRRNAEKYVQAKWGPSIENRHFSGANSKLNQLFYSDLVSAGEIKSAISEQVNNFRYLYETKPPSWWRRIPSAIIEELIVIGLKVAGRNL